MVDVRARLKKIIRMVINWNSSTLETYVDAAEQLVGRGFDVEDAAQFVIDLYSAAGNDFGE